MTIRRHARPPAMITVLAIAGLLLTACAGGDTLTPPRDHASPYDASRGEVLWAVVPLRNESGTTAADTLAISDKVVAAAESVEGIRALPLNRTIESMRSLGLTAITDPGQLDALARHMGVDGVIVGSVTAYDPYTPELGLTLALHDRGSSAPGDEVDPRRLASDATDAGTFPASRFGRAPSSSVSALLDGDHQGVQADVRAYAEGRSDPSSALSWRRYLLSMDLFTEYAAWHAVGRLLDREWIRLAGAASPAETPGR